MRISLLALSLLILPARLSAQDDPRCTAALRQLNHAPAPAAIAAAMRHLESCPKSLQGGAVASVVSRFRTADDLALLRVVWAPTVTLADAEVMAAARDIALDAAASDLARAFALRALWRLIDVGANADPVDMLQGKCGAVMLDLRMGLGAPLPANYQEQVLETRASIVGDATASANIRRAAACVVNGTAVTQQGPPIVTVQPDRVTITYVCGNRFLIRSPMRFPLHVTWDIEGTTARGKILLPAAPDVDGGYTSTEIDAGVQGTLRVFFQGTEIVRQANGNSAC